MAFASSFIKLYRLDVEVTMGKNILQLDRNFSMTKVGFFLRQLSML